MNSFKKALVIACTASVLSFGAAYAQTDPAAPAAPMATPDASGGDAMMKKPMMKKHMMKKHMMKKKMMKKKMMMKKAM